MALKKIKCFSCGKTLEKDHIGFREECDCGEDFHVCLNCKFYDENSYNECKEPTAERVKDKDRSNLCEHFNPDSEKGSKKNGEDDLFAAAEALFKK